MVILIGGVGYAGKTFMAQQLLEKYKYPYFSIDHLKMGLYRADIDCGFTLADSLEKISDKIWPILKGIIMTCIENRQNLIIEGGYLFPQKINELKNDYLSEVISFYLGFSDSYVEKYFFSNVQKYRSVIERRGYECEDTIEFYIMENRKQKELCEKYDAKYFEIHEDYEKERNFIFDWIHNELCGKLGEVDVT